MIGRADILAIGARWSNRGHIRGGVLRCSVAVLQALDREARELSDFLKRHTYPENTDAADLETLHYRTECGNIAAELCDALPGESWLFTPSPPPDETWRMHAGWLP